MRNRHRIVKRLIGLYAIGDLSPVERDVVSSHVKQCPLCRAELDRLQRVAEDLRSLRTEDRLSPTWKTHVLARIRQMRATIGHEQSAHLAGWWFLPLVQATLFVAAVHFVGAHLPSGSIILPGLMQQLVTVAATGVIVASLGIVGVSLYPERNARRFVP